MDVVNEAFWDLIPMKIGGKELCNKTYDTPQRQNRANDLPGSG